MIFRYMNRLKEIQNNDFKKQIRVRMAITETAIINWIISIKVGVKAEIKQIHFNLLGHGWARIHTDSSIDIRLGRMGTCESLILQN